MPLADGDPAEPWDTWLRVITDKNYMKSDGTLSNNAFSGRRVISPPDPPRPWSVELSGALLSLISDLNRYADDFCGANFAGYMYQKAENLKCEEKSTDVIFTPHMNVDEAHSDLVAYHLAVENKYFLRDWLQDNIQCVRPDMVQALDALRETA